MHDIIEKGLREHLLTTQKVIDLLQPQISIACNMVIKTIEQGNKLLLFGNGGSAGDAQHIAAEFTGRFVKERKGLPAIALTTDTSAITAIGNDYGFEKIFKRQIEALAKQNDLLIGISTSGNSLNVLGALELGKQMECKTLGLSGMGGGGMNACCELNIVIPSNNTARIQEMHILIGHILCAAIDQIS